MSFGVPQLEFKDFTEVLPKRPWKLSPREVAINVLTILVAIVVAPLLVQITPLKGKLGLVLAFLVVAMVGNILLAYLRQGKQAIGNTIASTLIYLAAGLVLLPVGSIFFTVIMRGYHALRINTFTQDMSVAQSDGPYNQGGALHAIIGTLILVLIASLISVPIGILTALYLTEVKGRAEGLIRFLVQAMSGVPSIVAGLFVYSVLIVGAGGHFDVAHCGENCRRGAQVNPSRSSRSRRGSRRYAVAHGRHGCGASSSQRNYYCDYLGCCTCGR